MSLRLLVTILTFWYLKYRPQDWWFKTTRKNSQGNLKYISRHNWTKCKYSCNKIIMKSRRLSHRRRPISTHFHANIFSPFSQLPTSLCTLHVIEHYWNALCINPMRPPPRKKCPVSFVLEETFQCISIVSFTLDVTNCVKTNFFHGQKIYWGKKSPHSSFGQNSSCTKAVMLELQI